MVARTNCGVADAHVPPVMTEPTAQFAEQDDDAPAPVFVGPVQET
jgi:hypothetical protein